MLELNAVSKPLPTKEPREMSIGTSWFSVTENPGPRPRPPESESEFEQDPQRIHCTLATLNLGFFTCKTGVIITMQPTLRS